MAVTGVAVAEGGRVHLRERRVRERHLLSGRMVPLSAVHSGVSNANGSASTATIAIPGLPKPLRAIHLSDSHTDLGPDAESGSLELCEMMYHCYNDGVGFPGDHNQQLERRGYRLLPLEALAGELEQAADEGVDLVLHTGDLLNFPSPKAGQHAAELLGAGGRPYLFISGNHDWQHSPPLPGAPEDLRDTAATAPSPHSLPDATTPAGRRTSEAFASWALTTAHGTSRAHSSTSSARPPRTRRDPWCS